MKTSKKIFAALLAVMMIVMMIPITASAAGGYSVKLAGKENYGYTIYKLADMNTTTYQFENAVESVADLVNTAENINTPAILAAADSATLTSSVATFTTSYAGELPAGLYYVKMIAAPAGVSTTKNANSVFAVPYTNADGTVVNAIDVTISSKVEDSEPTADKVFTNDKTASSITEFIGENISFTLTGSIVGSKDEKATKIALVDTMSVGVDIVGITSVKLTGAAEAADKPLTLDTDYTYTQAEDGKTFTVALTDTTLNADDTYNYTTLEVVYNAKLNENALRGIETGNTNTVELRYQNAYTTEDQVIPGPTKTVYTFDVNVVKQDGNNNTKKLSGAEFTLYTDEDCTPTSVAKNGTATVTNADGKATFLGIKAGTYYLKETKAPTGYNLNSTVFKVVVADNGTITSNGKTVTEIAVDDYPIVVPQTGGMGTMIFTIVGLSLIACAGVLFVVVRRKKASK